jgi:DNA-binding Lrp family transcriptional regulator
MSENTALDRTDFGIIAALQKDVRLSNKELAAKVGLSPSACLERVRALRRAGVLAGAHADIAPAALGIGLQALIAIRLARHSRDSFTTLRNRLLELEEVIGIYHVTGQTDLLLHVAVRDVAHLRDTVVEKIATRKEVGATETSVIFEARRKAAWPCYVELARGRKRS